MLKGVKINFRILSPRAFVFIRFILTQLLNSHLAYRIVSFHVQDRICNATSYRRLKQALNEHSSFFSFLVAVIRDWSFTARSSRSNTNPDSEEECDPNSSLKPPRNRRLHFLNNDPTAKRFRLNKRVAHIRASKSALQCYLCKIKTTVYCKSCRTHLCARLFGNNRKSCWEVHHTSTHVPLRLR